MTNRPAHCLEIYAVENDTLRPASTVAVGWSRSRSPSATATKSGGQSPLGFGECGAPRWYAARVAYVAGGRRAKGHCSPGPIATVLCDCSLSRPEPPQPDIGQPHRGGTGTRRCLGFDAANLDDSLNGNPLTILTLFADTPRAWPSAPTVQRFYAAPLFSGNGTTTPSRCCAQSQTVAAGEQRRRARP